MSQLGKRPFTLPWRRFISSDLVQGIVIGGVLAYITANRIAPIGILASVAQGNVFSGIVQSFFVGAMLAWFTASWILKDEIDAIRTTTNGWSTIMQCAWQWNPPTGCVRQSSARRQCGAGGRVLDDDR